MRKQAYLIAYALASLSRHWKKQLGLVLIYTLVVGFFSSVVFFTASLRTEAETVLSHLPELWVQKITGGRLEPIPLRLADSLRQFRGVAAVYPRIWGYLYDNPTGAVFTVIGADSVPDGLEMTALAQPLQPDQVWCGTGFLELRELSVGDRVTVQDSYGELRTFNVAGSFRSTSDLLTKDLMVLSPASARLLLGLNSGAATDLGVRIYNPAEVDNIARKIDQQYGGIRVVSLAQLRSTYDTLFGWRGGIFVYGALVSLLAFLILAWDRAAGLGSQERAELGILKGIGWSIADVLWMKLWEGMIVSLTATLAGMVLGVLHIFWLQAPLLQPFMAGWSVMYPSFHLLPSVGWGELLTISALSVVPYLTATLIPSWHGAITDPAEVMRG